MTGNSLIEMKKLFFDRPGMIKHKDRATTRFLVKAGAFVRRSARSAIRKSKKSSAPGQPPRDKTKRLKGSILFGLDTVRGRPSVLIGPTKLDSKNKNVRAVRNPISEILEKGGEVEVHEEQHRDGTWHQIRERRMPLFLSANMQTRWRRVTVQARPYMLPALRSNQAKFPGLWRGQFKKGK